MRKFRLSFLKTAFLSCFVLMFYSSSIGQTILISPTGDGGFENGTTFTSNGWTVVNHATNAWYVGGVPVPSAGTNAAYISNNTGTAHAYSTTSSQVSHFYRDVMVPSGQSIIVLGFKWKAQGESGFDYIRVWATPTSYTPVAGTQTTTSNGTQIGGNFHLQGSYQTESNLLLPPSYAGSTVRLIFEWRNDGSSGTQPPGAIDEISLTSAAPVPICNAGGTYTIDNTLPNSVPSGGFNFSSFTNAISYINANGICGPLTLNVTAGQTFTENPPALTATGTMSNPIIVQKSGAGANPVLVDIQGTSTSTDFGFCISGGDYITFDGIDVNSSTATTSTLNIEFGYLLRNASATDGAQNNTIKNCSITLNKNFVGTSASGCIYSSVSTSQGGIVPTNATGANSNNKFHNLTLSNAQNGVYLVGNSGFPDLNNEIGVAGTGCQTARNNITNMGGVSTFTSAYGIRVEGQNGVKVFNNDISNIRSNQAPGAGIISLTFAGTNEVYNNKIFDIANSGSTTSTSRAVGIESQNSTGTPTIRIYNNVIYDIKSPFTGTATASRYAIGIYCNNTSTATNAEVDNNSVYLSVASGTPTYSSSCFEMASSSAVHKVRGNIFVNAFPAQGATAKHFCWVSSSSTSIGATGSVSNYNDLFIVNDQGTSGHIGRGSTTNYNTLANWQAITPLPDANSLSVNPNFGSGTDLHATAASLNAVSGYSTQSWVTTDIECADRSASTPSDLGAYVINSCSVADGGTISPPTQSKCQGQTATMTSTGATSGAGITYQWKVSTTSGSGYVNVTGGTGATTTSYTSAPLTVGTYYYVLETTCSAGPTTDLSNELVVTVNGLPNVTVSPTSGSLCLPGGSAITLTASGANTYTWSPATGLSATTGATVTANPSITTTYVVTGTDNNSCTNTASAVITVTNTPVAPTTTNFGICVGGSIPSGQGLTSTSVGGSVITGSQTINFDVSSQPVETNSAPGNTVSSATMSALPAGSTVTSIVINYSGLVALSSSWRSEINLGLSGAIINAAAADPLAPSSAGTLNYFRTATSGITANNAGGTVNLLYWDSNNDNTGAEATFPTGTSVASLIINYSYPSPTAIAWYDAPTGGNFIANGSPFNPIGVDPALPNSNVAGSYTYYAQVNNGACSSTRSSAVLTIGSSPTATATATQSTICIGSSTTLTANPVGSSPFTYLWNDPSASSTQAVSVSPTSNTTYTVTVTDGCATTTTASITITVDAPTVGSPTATSVCGSGTSTLSTTGSVGTIRWYDAATNGTLIGTGTTVVSPPINSATTYYVNASNFGAQSTGLGSLGTPTPNNSLLSAERGIVVNVTSSGVLNSAQFYAASGAYAGTARLVNNTTGTQIASTAISGTAASAGMQTMNLNWELVAGTSYRLLLSLTSGSYSNNNSSVNYSASPWNNFGTNGSITSGYDSGVTSTSYSNFYNMSYTPACITSRTAVTVPYSVPPTIGTPTATPAAICPGSLSQLTISSSHPDYTYTWNPGSLTGASVSVYPSVATTYTVTAQDNTTGNQYSGCVNSAQVSVTVNPLPSAVMIAPTADVTLACGDPAVPLTASGGTIANAVILSENFNSVTSGTTTSGNLPAGWTGNSLTSGVRIWGVVASAQTGSTLGGGNFLYCESDGYTSFQTRSQVITPSFDASTFSAVNIKFRQYYNDLSAGTATDSARVFVSNDGGLNWVIQQAYDADQGTAFTLAGSVYTTLVLNAVPLTNNMKVKFVYNSDSGGNDWYWALDDVLIDGTQNTAITWSPTTGLYTTAAATPGTEYTGGPATTVYALPANTTTYTATATSAAGCTATASRMVTKLPCALAVNAKVFLSTVSGGTMPGTLRTLNLIPTADPYADAGQPYAATGNFTFVPAGQMATTTSTVINTNNVIDWVFVELRSPSTTVVASKSALLKEDGTIINPDGTALSFSGVSAGNYFVAVKHRNHLGFRTDAAAALPNAGVLDFTNGSVGIYPTTYAALRNNGGVYSMWPGDVNQNSSVYDNATPSDRGSVANAVITHPGNTGFFGSGPVNTFTGFTNVYSQFDVNLDGNVYDNATPSDSGIISNTVIIHPANTGFFGSGPVNTFTGVIAQY